MELSRTEEILKSILGHEEYGKIPQSRIEALLIMLGKMIEEGGVDPAKIKEIVEQYMEEHPVQPYDDTEIRKEIADLKLFKFPNATIVGEPLIESGNVSRFSNANYMIFPFVVDVRNKNFEINMCFTTGSDVTTQQNILDSQFGLALAIQNARGLMAMSSNGTGWDIGVSTGSVVVEPNKTYYAKMTWDGTTYKTALSTDGESFIDDMMVASSAGLHPTTIYIGGSPDLFGAGSAHPFKGTINLNKCHLSIAGLDVWSGMDDVGLSTRADVSLSNLDVEGEKRFSDIADTIEKLQQHTEKEFGDIWTIIHNEHPNDLLEIQMIVQNGDADKVFKIGDQITVPWKDTAADVQYSMDFDIVAFRDVELEDGRTVPGMILQAHWASPFGIQFSGNNALYYAADGLPAGTYNFEIGTTWGSYCVAGKKYQFTTTQDIPAGGQILIGRLSGSTITTIGGMSDYDPSTWRILTYDSSAAVNYKEVLTLTEGSAGTSLGRTTSSIKWSDGSDIWNLQAAAYGYNRWSQSAIRQFLNSSEEKMNWWTPQHKFDRRPEELPSKDGFLRGFGEDFLSILGKVKVQTACNYVTDGGTSTVPVIDTTFDTFFIPSLEEEYCVPQVAGVEGSVFPYWRERLPIDSPQASGSAAALAEHIRYSLNAKTSAQNARLRSASRNNAYNAWSVNSTGGVGANSSANSVRFAPACVIC